MRMWPDSGVKPAADRPPGDNDAHADPGADGDVNMVAAAARGAPFALGESGGGDVGVDRGRTVEDRTQGPEQIGARPALLGRVEQMAVARVRGVDDERAEAGDAERGDRVNPVPPRQPLAEQVDRLLRAGGRKSAPARKMSVPRPSTATVRVPPSSIPARIFGSRLGKVGRDHLWPPTVACIITVRRGDARAMRLGTRANCMGEKARLKSRCRSA